MTARVLLVLILLCGLAFLLRDQIIKGILERQLTIETGLPATVGRLDLKLRAHQITVENLESILSVKGIDMVQELAPARRAVRVRKDAEAHQHRHTTVDISRRVAPLPTSEATAVHCI